MARFYRRQIEQGTLQSPRNAVWEKLGGQNQVCRHPLPYTYATTVSIRLRVQELRNIQRKFPSYIYSLLKHLQMCTLVQLYCAFTVRSWKQTNNGSEREEGSLRGHCSLTARQIKSRRMRWAGHVARMGEKITVYKVWWESLKERDHSENRGVDGWYYNGSWGDWLVL
jgi:hypothetical protein